MATPARSSSPKSMVDPSTGTVTLRARFPNPQGVLLPGMFVRAASPRRSTPNAFLVPQPALSRDPRATPSSGSSARATRRSGARSSPTAPYGANWVVTAGLAAGRQGDHPGHRQAEAERRRSSRCRRARRRRSSPAGRKRPPGGRPGRRLISHVAHLHRPADLRLGASRSSSCWRASARSATLPVEQYPDVAPPQVNIRATYPGASAETVENSVTQIIEQQLTGIDGLLYFSSIVELARAGARSPPPSRRAPIRTSPRCRCRTRCSRRSRACRSRCSSRASGSPSPTPTS